jgi:predicted O-methyltransferase YrrM
MGTLANIIRNAYSGRQLQVMAMKVLRRFERDTAPESRQWILGSRVAKTEEFCKRIDEGLWKEAVEVCSQLEFEGRRKLESIGINLGGGGNYILAYFLARNLRPEVMVETGVAAGWTTTALLHAIEKNRAGELLSSDFPYFRLKNPHLFVGVLAENVSKSNWHLDLRGDSVALPDFVVRLGPNKIGLIHYDSDKSYRGRKGAIETLLPHISEDCVLIMDDIQDNLFFHDFVRDARLDHTIFEFEGKYLGVVEMLGQQIAGGSGASCGD